jgi:hypothetical protein
VLGSIRAGCLLMISLTFMSLSSYRGRREIGPRPSGVTAPGPAYAAAPR